MALKYRIPYSSVPTWWRNRINPRQQDGIQYYEIEDLCEDSRDVINPLTPFQQESYLTDGVTMNSYVKYSGENFQQTIPELKVYDQSFLALKGSASTVYFEERTGMKSHDAGTLSFSFDYAPMSGVNREYLHTGWGDIFLNYTNSDWEDYPYLITGFKGGMIYQGSYFTSNTNSQATNPSHRFDIWGDGTKLYVKDYNPPYIDTRTSAEEDVSYKYSYTNSPKQYALTPWGHNADLFYTVTLVIVSAGGGGSNGSWQHNGSGGGGGALGVFQLDLRNTSESRPITIVLGAHGGASGDAIDSSITYISGSGHSASTEGYIIGGGKKGASNSDMTLPGAGGQIVNYAGNSVHTVIKLIQARNGQQGGSGSMTAYCRLNGTTFRTPTISTAGTGGGGASPVAEGGKHAQTGGAYEGKEGKFPGGGGGGGSGPSQLGGWGAPGAAPWFGIIY